jgi:hypothetical protein
VADPQRALERVQAHVGLPTHHNEQLPTLNAGSYEPMAPDTRARLEEYFAPHNERLFELTGIDFRQVPEAEPLLATEPPEA